MKTSRTFSPNGKALMEGLVAKGHADRIEGGDYLLHFGKK